MKFTIDDSVTKQKVKFAVRKPSKDSHIEIIDEDQNDTLVRVFAKNGIKGIEVADNRQDVTVYNMSDGTAIDLENAIAMAQGSDPIPADSLRNWRIEKDKLKVVNPVTKAEIELPIVKPGPHTPKHAYEILGQHEMVFAVAYAFLKNQHLILTGPTGTGKTTIYRWFAHVLGYNYIAAPIARGTESVHLMGTMMPVGPAEFEWTDGPVSYAARLSKQHPTICVLDELNRIGNIAEFSDIYPMLDDTRKLLLREHRMPDGTTEEIEIGNLYVGATSNPSDDERADYIGVQDLDPALSSRFKVQPTVSYPAPEIEVEALMDRVPDLDKALAVKMVRAANQVRDSEDVRFPMSFRELEGWAMAYPYFGYKDAAKVAVINKAPRDQRASIAGILQLV